MFLLFAFLAQFLLVLHFPLLCPICNSIPVLIIVTKDFLHNNRLHRIPLPLNCLHPIPTLPKGFPKRLHFPINKTDGLNLNKIILTPFSGINRLLTSTSCPHMNIFLLGTEYCGQLQVEGFITVYVLVVVDSCFQQGEQGWSVGLVLGYGEGL